MVIVKYSQFISESKNSNLSSTNEYSEKMSILENEYLRLKSEGLTESEINENIFSSFLGSLGGGFTDTFKNYIIDWAAEKIGINPFDENGQPTFFYQVIRNVIEELHWTEIGKYFGKGSCKNWTKAIVRGLSETLQERGIEYLLPRLGLKIDTSAGMGGTIAAGLREALTNAVNNTGFMKNIEAMISDKICGFNLGDVLSSSSVSTTDKQKLQSKIETVGEKNPDIYTQAMKTGLADILKFNK
jgi:uncharacterized protein (DUF697 family)